MPGTFHIVGTPVRSHTPVVKLFSTKGDFKTLSHMFIHSFHNMFVSNIFRAPDGDTVDAKTDLPSLPLSCAFCSR